MVGWVGGWTGGWLVGAAELQKMERQVQMESIVSPVVFPAWPLCVHLCAWHWMRCYITEPDFAEGALGLSTASSVADDDSTSTQWNQRQPQQRQPLPPQYQGQHRCPGEMRLWSDRPGCRRGSTVGRVGRVRTVSSSLAEDALWVAPEGLALPPGPWPLFLFVSPSCQALVSSPWKLPRGALWRSISKYLQCLKRIIILKQAKKIWILLCYY